MGCLFERLPVTGAPVHRLVVASFLVFGILQAQNSPSVAETERLRRRAGVEEAELLLEKGDEAYRSGDFSRAMDAYSGARDLLPDAPITGELRQSATERYAQAAVEQGRLLVRKGDLAAAKAVVDRVLQPNVAPSDPGALAFRSQLDDPVRTNPASTVEHTRDVDEVRRLLYLAQGAYDLGKFDEAKIHYENILRIDSTNTAARRGMEILATTRSSHSQAAYDQTRAQMLSDVDAQWETALSPTNEAIPEISRGQGPADALTIDLNELLDRTIIDRVALEQASLADAIDFLRMTSNRPNSGNPPINFTLNLGPPDFAPGVKIKSLRFDLQLNNVPLRHVLKVVTDMTRTTYTTDGYSVIIRPLGTDSGEMADRTFRVPPDFLTTLASQSNQSTTNNNDPFADAEKSTGLLTQRMSVQQAMETQGVSFPEGAYIQYHASSSMLRVRNTERNLDIIQQIVETIAQTEPVMVSVKVTMIRTEKQHLEELGYDWLLTPVDVGGDLFAGGGTVGNSQGRVATDFTSPINGAPTPGVPVSPGALVNNGVVTNGLRSGDQAVTLNDLNQLIANPGREAQRSSVAPGILSLTGLFTDGQAQVVMRGLSQHKSVDLMATPSVITRSGQQASVEIVREFIYPTEYEPPEIPQAVGGVGGPAPVTPATPMAFETKPVGVELRVLPEADANKQYVNVTLEPTFSDLDGFVNFGSPIRSAVNTPLGGVESVTITENAILMPVFSVQKTNTQLNVADGCTFVYAGLLADHIQRVEDKVPVLGSLPVVGRLFASQMNKPVSLAIIFMVKVELIDPTGRPYRDR